MLTTNYHWQEESQVVDILLSLCEKHGFGRIPQIASQIEDIWRNPEKLKEYQEWRKNHLEFMAQCREALDRKG